jgi:hypothetical protein
LFLTLLAQYFILFFFSFGIIIKIFITWTPFSISEKNWIRFKRRVFINPNKNNNSNKHSNKHRTPLPKFLRHRYKLRILIKNILRSKIKKEVLRYNLNQRKARSQINKERLLFKRYLRLQKHVNRIKKKCVNRLMKKKSSIVNNWKIRDNKTVLSNIHRSLHRDLRIKKNI